jgi:FkbM family methyltransferase
MGETIIVRAIRAAFRIWPFQRGRGWILRVAKLLLDERPVVIEIGDRTFIQEPLDDYVVLWSFMGLHEADEPFQRSLSLIGAGDVVLDVGANFGTWSLLAARRTEPANVYAFEAVPSMAERFRFNARLNGMEQIHLNVFALGAEERMQSFFAVSEGNRGASSFIRRTAGDVEIEVPVRRLDAYIEETGIARVHLMKVDVEGAELLIFRGARRLLTSEEAPILFFEASDELSARFGFTQRDVKSFLLDCGYALFRWRESSFRKVGMDESHLQEDLFALKPRHLHTLPAGKP